MSCRLTRAQDGVYFHAATSGSWHAALGSAPGRSLARPPRRALYERQQFEVLAFHQWSPRSAPTRSEPTSPTGCAGPSPGGRPARPGGAPQVSSVARRQACSVSGATRLMHRLDCSPQVPERRDGGAADVTRRRQLLQTTRGTGGSAIRSGHGRPVPARSVAISSRCATSIQLSSPAMPAAALPPCPGRQRNKARPPSSCSLSPRTPKASRASTSKTARKRNCYIRTTFTGESPTTRSTAPAPLACGRSRRRPPRDRRGR